MGEVYIGTSAVVGSGVLVKIFGAETERGKVLVVIFFPVLVIRHVRQQWHIALAGRYSGGWTVIDCIPVFDNLVTSSGGLEHSR